MPDAWSRNRQAVAISLWVSFLSAAVGSVFVFAFIDPLLFFDAPLLDVDGTRNVGYAIGFFFLWAICLSAAAVSAYLVRTAPKRPKKHNLS